MQMTSIIMTPIIRTVYEDSSTSFSSYKYIIVPIYKYDYVSSSPPSPYLS